MLHHHLNNCPLPPLVVVILPAASNIVASHAPNPLLLPSPPPSSFPFYHILFDCYIVICCPSSVVHCPSSIVHCPLSVVCCLPSTVVSSPHLPLFLLKIVATAGLKDWLVFKWLDSSSVCCPPHLRQWQHCHHHHCHVPHLLAASVFVVVAPSPPSAVYPLSSWLLHLFSYGPLCWPSSWLLHLLSSHPLCWPGGIRQSWKISEFVYTNLYSSIQIYIYEFVCLGINLY